ncbi:hypothetical protein [Streptomyces sp. NPDC048473]|uniref:hypothetical protein n=1 Tax=unclassified Streptomyces TaxID=2593676 RepID=UPI00371C4B6B
MGRSSGIARAVSDAALKEGARVIAVGRNRAVLQARPAPRRPCRPSSEPAALVDGDGPVSGRIAALFRAGL